MIMERREEREAAWLGQLRKSKHTNSLSARKMRGEDRSRLHLKSSVAAVVELARRARKKKKNEKKRKEKKRREKKRGEAETRLENASQSERECFLRGSAMVKVLVYKQLPVLQLSVWFVPSETPICLHLRNRMTMRRVVSFNRRRDGETCRDGAAIILSLSFSLSLSLSLYNFRCKFCERVTRVDSNRVAKC